MRAIKKSDIYNIYKVTCKDLRHILKGTYKKKLGSNVITCEHIVVTNKQMLYLLGLECRNKALVGYLRKIDKNRYEFVDLETFIEEYISLDGFDICRRCLDFITRTRGR